MNRIDSLQAFLADHADDPFVWGQTDCCMFVANWVEALTGKDYAEPYRGKYSDQIGAMRILAEHGGMVKFIESMLGDVQPPLTARRGDIVWGDYEEGPAVGIMAGHAAAYVCDNGIAMKPLETIKGCWHV